MRKKYTVWILIVAALLLLSACNLPNKDATPTPDANFVFTAAALTVQSKLAETTPVPPLPTEVIPDQPTIPQPPTQVPPTQPLVATVDLPPTATPQPCDAAEFVEDVTIPDGTNFAPGATFTKTWRIKNTGSCTWTTGYALVFESGASMGGPAAKPFSANVAPNQTVDLSVDLKAPDEANDYKGNWKLRNGSGVVFGLTSENKSFWVDIKVVKPTALPFAVSNATFSMIPSNYSGVCPFPILLVGKIKSNGAGSVTYSYQREDGFSSPPMTVTFSEASEKTLPDYTMPMGTVPGFTWTGKIWLRIEEPNHQNFDTKSFTIVCIAP